MNKFLVRAFSGLTLFAAAGISLAQTSQGTLAGVVRDTTGAVVPNAVVTLRGESDGLTRSVKTQADGAFRADALPPERYELSIAQAGFSKFDAQHIVVNASVVNSFDVTLSVGSANDTVSVEAAQSGIDTENGQLSANISTVELSNIPIFSLSPYELAYTAPGAQVVSSDGSSNGQDVQVNGARPRANNFLLDSQEINDVSISGQAFQPSIPDSYENLTVLTSNASAEFGRAGGGVLNLTTKRGTNSFHGSVFERYEGSGLNAIGGDERGQGITKSRFDQHNYGFTAGGPILRNKLFAFGGLQIERFYGKETPNVLELPDATGYAQLQAIATSAGTGSTVAAQVALLDKYLSNGSYLTAYNPISRPATAPCGSYGNVVACQNVGPQAPICTANGSTGCNITEAYFERPAVNANEPDTQWTYRIDYTPWQKDSFYVRYLHDRSSFSPDFPNNGSALVGFDTQQGGPAELGTGGWTHIFTNNLLNEFRASETRLNFQFGPTAATLANPLYALYSVSVSGLPALGPNQNFPQGRGEDLYQFQDTVSWTKGAHTMRMGFDIGRQLEKDLVSQNAKGTLTFAKGGTVNGVSYVTALGNYLQNQLGPSGTATRTFGPTRIDPHDWRNGIFFQDDWKVRPDLTVNLGIRYDYLGNPENSLAFPALDPSNPFGILSNASGTVQGVRYAVNNDKNNVGPRVGFSWNPRFGGFFGDGKTVVRGGIGVFYDSDFSNFTVNAAQTSPNAPTGTLTQTTGYGLSNATSLIGTIPATLTLASSVTSVNNNMVNPLTYQYNLGIERELKGGWTAAVRYVATRGEKLFANQQFNYFSGATGKRLNPTYGAIISRGNYADSDYNALELDAEHAFSHGFTVRASYDYSKDLDDGSDIFTTASSPTSYSANLAPGGRRQDWGPSDFDHRHYGSIVYVWSPKGFHANNEGLSTVLQVLTADWTVSGVTFWQSGNMTSFNTSGLDINGDGSTTNDRPIIGNVHAPSQSAGVDGAFVGGTPGVYYDVAANNATNALNPVSPSSVRWLIPYMPLNQYLQQEIGRGSYQNPGQWNTNLALQKGFGMPDGRFERVRFVIRAEASDLFNHNNTGILNLDVLNIGNGLYQNRPNALSDTGRTLNLWGKVTF